ncbi:phage holin family protein [Sphingobium bisphenolivorans]|uniref:phage holin family protein n=1 Tax=Sphingobium bisphenolivorans TaxID=1335760 RepID=UPI0003A09437|nr:phage holin family protein [Sphingobium bisphenolivorans]
MTDPQYDRVVPPGAGVGREEDIASLLRSLMGQGTHLAEQQLALLKAEVRESATGVKVAVGAIAGAAVVGIAGLGVLLMGLAYLLADAIDHLGLATLIVGIVTLIVAFILYRSAIEKMRASELTPERTQHTLERTPAALRGDLNPEHRS